MVAAAFYLIFTSLLILGLIWFLIGSIRGERWGCASFLALVLVAICFAGWRLYSTIKAGKQEQTRTKEEFFQKLQRAQAESAEAKDDTEAEEEESSRPSYETIEVRTQSYKLNIAILLGFFCLTGALASPGSFGSRGAGITVSVLFLLGAGGIAYWGLRDGRPLYVADRHGIEERRVSFGTAVTRNRVAWSQVKSAVYEQTQERADYRANSPVTKRTTSRRLRLFDSAGNELMWISQPWQADKVEPFDRLLRAIPGWTGCEVVERRPGETSR